jgi:hypothetical protein
MTSGGEPEAPSSEASAMASFRKLSDWAEQAVKSGQEQASVTYKQLQQKAGDLESGDAGPQWVGWAQAAADRARKSVSDAAANANTAEWGNQLSSSFGKVSDLAGSSGANLSEHAKAAQLKASHVAGSSSDLLKSAGAGLGSSLSGMGAMAMNPMKLIQSAAIFFVGMMLITLSLSFLPLLPVAPSKFALLFALGSLAVLGSVAWLKGPSSFVSAVTQRDKLPFTIAYGVGLVGTLWATIIAKSYVFTGVFAFIQVVGLLYFMASFVPGGKTVLNFFGKLSGRCMRMLMPGSK